MLEAQHLVVGGEVRFGVLSAEGELPDVAQMFLFAGSEQAGRCCVGVGLRVDEERRSKDKEHRSVLAADVTASGECIARGALASSRRLSALRCYFVVENRILICFGCECRYDTRGRRETGADTCSLPPISCTAASSIWLGLGHFDPRRSDLDFVVEFLIPPTWNLRRHLLRPLRSPGAAFRATDRFGRIRFDSAIPTSARKLSRTR